MESFSIDFSKQSIKFLDKLPSKDRVKIIDNIELLKNGYSSLDVKNLVGMEDRMRLRVGKYRVIFRKFDNLFVISIIKIGHRKDVYRNL